jgi:hypothetical protein
MLCMGGAGEDEDQSGGLVNSDINMRCGLRPAAGSVTGRGGGSSGRDEKGEAAGNGLVGSVEQSIYGWLSCGT